MAGSRSLSNSESDLDLESRPLITRFFTSVLTFEIQKVLLPLFIGTVHKVNNCFWGEGVRKEYGSTGFNRVYLILHLAETYLLYLDLTVAL